MSFLKVQRERGNLRKEITTLSTVEVAKQGLNKLAFDQALNQSKKIKDIEEKVAFKKTHLPSFLPHALKYLETGKVENETLLFTAALWCFDINDIDNAVNLSIFAIKQGLETPTWFSTNIEQKFTYLFCEWASPKINKGESVEPYLGQWLEAAEDWQEVNDIQSGMLKVFAAKVAHQAKDYKTAVTLYEQALEINSGAGVKTNLDLAKKEKEFVVKK